jgi:hypothetical protein
MAAVLGSTMGAAMLAQDASATLYQYSFTGDGGVTASATLDVEGGLAVAGTGTITSSFFGTQALTLMTPTSHPTGVNFCCGPDIFSYRWTGGKDLIGNNAVPLDSWGLVFGVGAPITPDLGTQPGFAYGFNPWDGLFQLAGANGDYLLGSGTSTFAIASVPEPSTWAMMILGFAGIGAMTYRRRKQSVALAA